MNDSNVFWGNDDGDLKGSTYGPDDPVIDPEFCDSDSGDVSLNETSLSLPENAGPAGLIGALGQGCGQVAVEAHSWGQIKSHYRGQREGDTP